MEILLVKEGKRAFLHILLLADEQETMIDRYLHRGDLYVLYDPDVRAACVVTDEGEGVFELQNIAVLPPYQRLGYGRMLVMHVIGVYAKRGSSMIVGTGDSPVTVPFYEHCGFAVRERVKDYFLTAYDHPIYEDGLLLRDRVILSMSL